jgi:hypothetical protein
LYLETDKLNYQSEINIDKLFGRRIAELNQTLLFNLQDTTSIEWSGDFDDKFYLSKVIMFDKPTIEMSSTDSLKWIVSHKHRKEGRDKDDNYRRTLTVTNELLGIMQKDYSILERFPEYYK